MCGARMPQQRQKTPAEDLSWGNACQLTQDSGLVPGSGAGGGSVQGDMKGRWAGSRQGCPHSTAKTQLPPPSTTWLPTLSPLAVVVVARKGQGSCSLTSSRSVIVKPLPHKLELPNHAAFSLGTATLPLAQPLVLSSLAVLAATTTVWGHFIPLPSPQD